MSGDSLSFRFCLATHPWDDGITPSRNPHMSNMRYSSYHRGEVNADTVIAEYAGFLMGTSTGDQSKGFLFSDPMDLNQFTEKFEDELPFMIDELARGEASEESNTDFGSLVLAGMMCSDLGQELLLGKITEPSKKEPIFWRLCQVFSRQQYAIRKDKQAKILRTLGSEIEFSSRFHPMPALLDKNPEILRIFKELFGAKKALASLAPPQLHRHFELVLSELVSDRQALPGLDDLRSGLVDSAELKRRLDDKPNYKTGQTPLSEFGKTLLVRLLVAAHGQGRALTAIAQSELLGGINALNPRFQDADQALEELGIPSLLDYLKDSEKKRWRAFGQDYEFDASQGFDQTDPTREDVGKLIARLAVKGNAKASEELKSLPEDLLFTLVQEGVIPADFALKCEHQSDRIFTVMAMNTLDI